MIVVCERCGRAVRDFRRFAYMIDGILVISVPLCIPCNVQVTETLEREIQSYVKV